jgi:Phosphotransferase enzyme family
MDTATHLADTTEYRVALIDPSAMKLLAESDVNGLHLPRVRIPKWTRPAEEINEAIRKQWQVTSIVLTILETTNDRPGCAVTELISSPKAGATNTLLLRDVECLGQAELNAEERASLNTLIAGEAAPSGPFARRGWLKEAQEWIQSSIPDREIEFTKEIHQLNAGEAFALIRLGTKDGGAYWLKATGNPNKHERAFSVELSRRFPEYLPSLIADREDWNAWVTEDAGEPLGGTRDFELLLKATESLADLQILSHGHVAELRAAGFMDRRLAVMQAHLPEMFSYLEEAMRRQTSTRVKPLERARLQEILSAVDHACEKMQELGIPDCLVCGDINLDNILFDGTRIRFTDWAEGGIGNPFFTFEQVLQHVIREGEHLDWVPRLCEAYRKKWLPLLRDHQIDSAFTLMPLLAMADTLFGRGNWLGSPRQDEPAFQSFARTLSRCMDRAAAELSSLEVQLS